MSGRNSEKNITLAGDIPTREFHHTGYTRLIDLENITAQNSARMLVNIAENILKAFVADEPGHIPEKTRERGIYQQIDDRLSRFDESLRSTVGEEMNDKVVALGEQFAGQLQQFLSITAGNSRLERTDFNAMMAQKLEDINIQLIKMNRDIESLKTDLQRQRSQTRLTDLNENLF